MSLNSSLLNESLLHPNFTTTDSNTFLNSPGYLVYSTLLIISTSILLPLWIFVLQHGAQQWRKRRSTASAAAISHADIFTYHMVLLEPIAVLRCFLCCYGVYRNDYNTFSVCMNIFCFTWYGQLFFHTLLCVECYLAVVHPITYLSLRTKRGIRMRNISIGCVWILSCVGASLMTVQIIFIFVDLSLLLANLIVVSFCSVSVLYVLIRPGPMKQGKAREKVDQSKLRAFYTILGILGGLLARFAWGLSWDVFHLLGSGPDYVVFTSEALFSLPCSLVLPLLFLHRKGKLQCFKINTQ